MRSLFFLLAVGVLSACAKPSLPPPDDATPGRIAIIADTESPFWASMIREEIPQQINKRARYELVNKTESNPYKLHVSIYDSQRWISGYDDRGNARYGVRVEVKAALTNAVGSQVWKWSGWYQHNSASRAMANIGVLMANKLEADGFLSPAYYRDAK